VHRQFTYCHTSGLLANHFCPDYAVVTRVGIVRPQPIDHLTETVNHRWVEIPLGVREGQVCDYHTEHTYVPDVTDWFNNWNWWETYEFAPPMPTPTPPPNYNQPPDNQFPSDIQPPPEPTPMPTLPPPEPTPTPPPATNDPDEGLLEAPPDADTSWITGLPGQP